VAEKLRDAQARIARGRPAQDESIRLDVFLDHWLEHVVKPSVKPGTHRRYCELVRAVLKKTPIAARTLRDLRPAMIHAALCTGTGRGRSRAKSLTILKQALEQAVTWEFLRDNPARSVKPARYEKQPIVVWTASQARAFLRAAKSDRYYGIYYLALHTAMRQGEILGLQWADVNLRAGTIRVANTLEPIDRTLGKPKTPASMDTLSIGPDVVELLLAHRGPRAKRGYVFVNDRGAPVLSTNLRSRSFAPLILAAKVPKIRFHDLRHTTATLLLEAGVPLKVVSERLRHGSITITADTYQHVSPALERTASTKMTTILAPKRAGMQKDGGRAGGQEKKPPASRKKKTPTK
jgi:integrase